MTPDEFTQHADDAYEAIRAMNHSAINTTSIPAPEVYSVLGNLTRVGQSLSELASHLSRCLEGSLSDPAFRVYDRDPDGIVRDPVVQAAHAAAELELAAEAAVRFRDAVGAAQTEINGQGYHLAEDESEAQQ